SWHQSHSSVLGSSDGSCIRSRRKRLVRHHGSDSAGKWAWELPRSSPVGSPCRSRICCGCPCILRCCRHSTPDGSFGEFLSTTSDRASLVNPLCSVRL